MEKVFIGFSFGPAGKELATLIESLLESHDIAATTGEVLEGQPLTQAVTEAIQSADGLIGVLTPEHALETGRFRPSEWVHDEITIARTLQKPTVAFVAPLVDVKGAFAENERVDSDPLRPLDAFVKLSGIIGAWKRRLGRRVKVRVLPPELEHEIGKKLAVARCRYRLTRDRDGAELHPWRDAVIRLEPGGAFAFLEAVQADAVIELQILLDNTSWGSRATPQWLHVELAREVR